MPIQLFESENHASTYVRARPSPPSVLINKILDYLGKHHTRDENETWPRALDVGAGSGQTTFLIKDYFSEVLGVDISAAQIAEANKRNTYPNISFKVSTAESIPLEDESVDLITASQCLHWFDLESFYREVDRLLVPGGVFAAFGYLVPAESSECSVDDKLATHIRNAYEALSEAGYWEQPYMDILHSCYENLKLPFKETYRETGILSPILYTGQNVIDYVTSWSAYNTLKKQSPDEAKDFIEALVKNMQTTLNVDDITNEKINLTFQFFLTMSRK